MPNNPTCAAAVLNGCSGVFMLEYSHFVVRLHA